MAPCSSRTAPASQDQLFFPRIFAPSRKTYVLLHFSAYHHPRLACKCDDLIEHVICSATGNRNEIGAKAGTNSPEQILLTQGHGSIECYRFQNFFRSNGWEFVPKRLHLG